MSKIKKEKKKYVNDKIALRSDTDETYESDESDVEGDVEYQKVKEEGQEFQNVMQSGAITTKNGDVTIHSITIIGQIEGHYAMPPQNKTTKYEHIIPMLVAIEENPEIDGLLIILNTVGGDVEAGLAIAEMIASMKKPTCSLVLGGGHSIGVPLAVCTKISYIVPSATMTIHPVRMNGLVIGVEQSFTYLTKMQERINKFIIKHSKLSDKKLNELMFNTQELSTDVGSIVDGDTAVTMGLIGKTGGLKDSLESLREVIKRNRKNEKKKQKSDKTEDKN